MKLCDYTDRALERELSRRKVTLETVPKADQHPNDKRWNSFVNHMQDYANRVALTGYSADDDEHYIYEEACILAFGNVFFDWYNRVVK